MNKTVVLILFGGVSNEHEVSLRSATSIINNIDRSRFEPVLVGITKDGRWLLYNGDTDGLATNEWQQNATPAMLSADRETNGLFVFEPDGVRTVKIDVIFPAVHGQNCEDGALQGLMTLSGIPFIGCGVTASALSFDKVYTHIIAEQAGVPMAKWQLVCREEDLAEVERRVAKALGYPCFVKPANSGSSVGCSRANDAEGLFAALKLAFAEDRRVIVEELVTAHEVECAVMGNLEPIAPTTGEIVSPDGFYDYDTKYKNDHAKLFIPACIPETSAARVRELALTTYRALNCRGLSRVDFFVKKDGSVLLNEINTLPGFTSISMYPKMMIASGMTYGEVITRLIELALIEKSGA
ncbi:D-alanine--D-alanine ligase family protein [Oscillospiraceae bacterium LTW-04]|nr:D-alanine--D-alanine ligase family protein [Oscillospiraceae bacterium MB24-C1]